MFFSFSRWSLLFVDSFHHYEKTFLVWCSPIGLFLLLWPLPEKTDQKNVAKTDVKEGTAYILFQEFYGFRSHI